MRHKVIQGQLRCLFGTARARSVLARVSVTRTDAGGWVIRPRPHYNMIDNGLTVACLLQILDGQLSTRQLDELHDMLRGLIVERKSIEEGMMFCLDHSEAADEIVEALVESLAL